MVKENNRKIVIPGELITSDDKLLPGDGTQKTEKGIISLRYGLADESNGLTRVIKLSGVYEPRRGNVVVGIVTNVHSNGWFIDFGGAEEAFLSLTEVPMYVDKNGLTEVMDIDDVVTAKISEISSRGINVTIKQRGLGKAEEGIVMKINSNKIPRVIGKEGSMVKLIKDETGCNITAGQNGYILIKGDKIEDELLAKKAILFVTEKSFIEGLTDAVTKWFSENKK